MSQTAVCSETSLGFILPLRHRVLRAGFPLESARFEGDEHTEAHHFAACLASDPQARPVCCLSLLPSRWEGHFAWQLRGMATEEAHRGQGFGAGLLRFAEARVAGMPPSRRLIWCNARLSAAGFYERFGWLTVSEPFEIPTVGTHIRMLRRLG
jgi:GNAT superfamily N-acetyltransferase